MADAYEDKLAAAIATEFNDAARGWHSLLTSESCTAAAALKAWHDLTDLATLKVSIVPVTIERQRIDRGSPHGRKFDYAVMIDWQRVIDPTDYTTLKAYNYAAEQCHDFFDDAHDLTGMTGWICLEADRRDVNSLWQLYENRVWETMIAVKVRGYRQ